MDDLRTTLLNAGVPEDRLDAVLAALPAPDAANWNPEPEYLRELLKRSGMGTRRASDTLGIGNRDFRHYLAGSRECPYLVQYALEILAELNIPENAQKPQSEDTDDG